MSKSTRSRSTARDGSSGAPSKAKAKAPKTKKAATPNLIDVRSKAFQDIVDSAVKKQLDARQPPTQEEEEEEEVDSSVMEHLHDLTGEKDSVVSEVTFKTKSPKPPSHVSDVDKGMSLDYYVPSNVRSEILQHKYIDLSILSKKAPQKQNKNIPLAVDPITNQIVMNPVSTGDQISNIEIWVTNFTIYATVIIREQPEQAIGLLHYLSHIRKLAATRHDWIQYDQSYRKLHESNPEQYYYGRNLMDLQMDCKLDPSQQSAFPNQQQQKGSRKRPFSQSQSQNQSFRGNQFSNQPFRGESATGGDFGKRKQAIPFPWGTCWTFQWARQCNGCDFPDTHKCCFCSQRHPGIQCESFPVWQQLSAAERSAWKRPTEPKRPPTSASSTVTTATTGANSG